jgi:hypothetical protein
MPSRPPVQQPPDVRVRPTGGPGPVPGRPQAQLVSRLCVCAARVRRLLLLRGAARPAHGVSLAVRVGRRDAGRLGRPRQLPGDLPGLHPAPVRAQRPGAGGVLLLHPHRGRPCDDRSAGPFPAARHGGVPLPVHAAAGRSARRRRRDLALAVRGRRAGEPDVPRGRSGRGDPGVARRLRRRADRRGPRRHLGAERPVHDALPQRRTEGGSQPVRGGPARRGRAHPGVRLRHPAASARRDRRRDDRDHGGRARQLRHRVRDDERRPR